MYVKCSIYMYIKCSIYMHICKMHTKVDICTGIIHSFSTTKNNNDQCNSTLEILKHKQSSVLKSVFFSRLYLSIA